MSVEYSKRALDDLDCISPYYAERADPGTAERFEARFQGVIGRLERSPASAQSVTERPGIRVALLNTFPYKVSTAFWERTESGSFTFGIRPGALGVADVVFPTACLRGQKGPF